jgi:hypothetical protein
VPQIINTAIWDVMPCGPVDSTNIVEEPNAAVLGIGFLQNITYHGTWCHTVEDLNLSFL